MTIWALYDDGQRCYWNTIKKYFPDIKVIGIGINDCVGDYVKMDLSIFNNKLLEQLSQLEKPDIILASPPCESWSNADTIENYKSKSLILNNYNFFLEQNQKFYANQHKHMYRNFFNKQRTRLLGEATQLALNLIIRTFNPKVWVIENPTSAKSWLYQKEFLNFDGIENRTYYNCYDFPIKKPTIFKSNINLNLKQDNIKSSIPWKKVSGYDIRSKIPELLIKDILEKCINHIQSTAKL